MALLTQYQFAKETGTSTAKVNMAKKRGQLIMSGDLIDTSIEKNALLFEKWCNKSGINEATPVLLEKPVDPIAIQEEILEKKKEKQPKKPKAMSEYGLDAQKKALDIELITEKIAIEKVKKEKLQGLVIPTELVKSVILGHSESLKIAYNEASENLIVIFGTKAQLSTVDIAAMRTELVKTVNAALDKAIYTTKKNIKNIVKEYSQTRGVGEHD